MEAALKAERGQLDVHKQQIKDFVDNKLRTYYGVEEGKPITLSAVLGDAITSYDASLKAQIAEAVKALPAKYREVLHLYYQEGYPTKEISKILNRNESSIRSDLKRGREALKQVLKEAYDFE